MVRIWCCWVILALVFVFVCGAGWGLSPQAAEKIQQLKQKYSHEKVDVAKPGFRELAGALREKQQQQQEKLPVSEEIASVAAEVPDRVAATAIASMPATGNSNGFSCSPRTGESATDTGGKIRTHAG